MDNLGTEKLKVIKMKFSYNKLWKLLIDKGWTKSKLREEAKISSSSMAKLSNGGNVTTEILVKICGVLDCDISDIAEIVKTPTVENNSL
jgi:hypothetical protein